MITSVIKEAEKESVQKGSSKITAFCKDLKKKLPGFEYDLIMENVDGFERIVGKSKVI